MCEVEVQCTKIIRIGWPGSTHDNRVWTNCALHTNSWRYFGASEYLLGDSAYSEGPHLVPAFKKMPNQGMQVECEKFNRFLARLRIKVEHAIGMLKGKFQHLKRLRLKLACKRDVEEIIRVITVAVILHNICLEDQHAAIWLEHRLMCACNVDMIDCPSCYGHFDANQQSESDLEFSPRDKILDKIVENLQL